MKIRRAGLLSLALASTALASACALPAKTNPNDPSNAPSSALRIVDATTSDLVSCGPVGTSTANVVAVSSRARCLVLDASGTVVPHGGPVTYVFSMTTAQDAAPSSFAEIHTSPSPTFVLGSNGGGLLAQLPVGPILYFSVVAHSGDANGGSRDPALATLTLQNSRPRASIDPPRQLPVGGFPWNATLADPNAAVVRFHGGGSKDPDHDPIQAYCWKFTAIGSFAPVDAGCTTTPDYDLPISLATAGTVRAELRVSDGKLVSLPVITTVGVGKPDVLFPTADLYVSSLDISRTRVPIDSIVPFSEPIAAFMKDLAHPRVIAAYFDGTIQALQTGDWPDYTNKTPKVNTGFRIGKLVPDPARNRVFAFTRDATNVNGKTTLVHLYDLSTQIPTEVGGFPVDLNLDLETDLYSAAVAADGSIYYGGVPFSFILHIMLDGSTTTIDATDGQFFGGMEERPGAGEVWTLEAPNFFAPVPGTTSSPAGFRVLTSQGERFYSTGHDYAFGIAWVDGDQFWTSIADLGLVRVDALALDLGVPFEDAIMQIAPEIPIQDSLVLRADPLDGGCWAAGIDGRFVDHVTSGGNVSMHENDGSAPDVTLQFADSDGKVWSSTNSTLERGRDVSSDLSLRARYTYSKNVASYDPSTGGFWSAPIIPSELERWGLNLERAKTFTRVENAAPLFPFVLQLAPSPDGSIVWGVVSDGLTDSIASIDRFDVTDASVARTQIFNLSTANNITASTTDVAATLLLEASAPVPSSTPFLWLVRNDKAEVQARPADGSYDGSAIRYVIPAAERDSRFGPPSILAAMANSPRSNKLCFLDGLMDTSTSTFQVYVRRIASNGNPATITPTVLNISNPSKVSLAAFANASTDLCWIAASDDSPATNGTFNIAAITTGGVTPLHTYSEAGTATAGGRITSIFPISASEVWLSVEKRPAAGLRHTEYVHLVFGAGSLVTSETAFVAPLPNLLFAGPGIASDVRF